MSVGTLIAIYKKVLPLLGDHGSLVQRVMGLEGFAASRCHIFEIGDFIKNTRLAKTPMWR